MDLEALRKKLLEQNNEIAAVLLEAKPDLYLRVLGNPLWKERVEAVFGEELYADLATIVKSEIYPEFSSRSIEMADLEFIVNKKFDLTDFETAIDLLREVNMIATQAGKFVYRIARQRLHNNDDLIYKIYKDADISTDIGSKTGEERIRQEFEYIIYRRINGLHQCLRFEKCPVKIIQNAIKNIRDYFPDQEFSYENRKVLKTQLEDLETRLKNPVDFNLIFHKYLIHLESSKRKRVIESGNFELKSAHTSSCMLIEYLFRKDQEHFIELCEYHDLLVPNLDKGVLSAILNGTRALKQQVLSDYNTDFRRLSDVLTGLKQLAEGGRINNPNAHPMSVVQNHAGFPNIRYTSRQMKKFYEFADRIQEKFDKIPDITDLELSIGFGRTGNQRYEARELDKDPFDLSFGNESGSCIFIPKDIKEIQTGIFIPEYLDNPRVRLIGVYKKGKNKRRIGLILAFDTSILDFNSQDKVLACNSLEISRTGVIGGIDSIRKITAYMEDWVIKYAEDHGYHGVTMGNHSWNTGSNYSRRNGALVKDTLILHLEKSSGDLFDPFYSDILVKPKDSPYMVIPQNASYWLWKKI